tara:strand:- start:1116 stop:1586 length:471 start_codon:yes stop_codon:yes gene_type:complete
MNDKKKYITETLQSIEAKKKSLKLKKIKIIKSINALKIEEKELKKELKKINQSDQLIVSVGFDKRWSSYNCIVKFRTFHFSIYLGNEQKIKKALQQFHKNDINDKKIEVIKTEIKQMVSSVIAPYLIKYKTKDKLSFGTIIDLYIGSGDWDYWRAV